jgi:uncharacterized protein (TIGR03083 family)
MTSFPEYLNLIDDRSAALRAAVTAASDNSARVPGCPAWNLRDLVLHLGRVQRFWSVVVAAGPADRPPPLEAVPEPEPTGDLLEWSAGSTRLLLAALGDAGPDAPSWTWWPTSGAPQTVAAVARHQVEEAGVHAYDAQDAIGKPEPVPAAVAVDGVAEFLQVTFGAEGPWLHPPARVAFTADEGPSWVLDLSEAGAALDPARPGPAADAPGSGAALHSPGARGGVAATVRGPASDILLALYSRIPLSRLQIDGDAGLIDRLQAWGDTE